MHPFLEAGRWKFDIAKPLLTPPEIALQPITSRQDVQTFDPRVTQQFCMRLATANVLTLFPGQEHASGYTSVRAEGLAAQFHALGFHVIGLQETRSRQEGHVQMDHFHVLSAPASQRGVGGIQLWVHRNIRDGDFHLPIEPHHLRILHATAQRLVVRLACGDLRVIFVVLHAPTEADDSVLQKFWSATSAAIPKQYRSWRLFVLADANSRVGSVCSNAVGDWHAETENLKGQYFHQWLQEHSALLATDMEHLS